MTYDPKKLIGLRTTIEEALEDIAAKTRGKSEEEYYLEVALAEMANGIVARHIFKYQGECLASSFATFVLYDILHKARNMEKAR